MSKFYGVRIGKVVGIYNTWKDCKANTSGFPNAAFKSFGSFEEAHVFVYGMSVAEKESRARDFMNVSVNSKTMLSMCQDMRNWKFVSKIEIKPGKPYSVGPGTPGYEKFGKKYHLYDRNLLNTDPRMTMIYIDGSKMPSVNHLGSGAYLRFMNQDYTMSRPFCSEVASRYCFTKEELDKLSSPTMEYLALSEILWQLLKLKLPLGKDGLPQMPNPRLKLVFVGDYNGVKYFSEGTWKPQETHIIKIHQVSSVIMKWLKDRGIDIEFIHVNGHIGILGNELSDIAAKCTQSVNNIDAWVEMLGKFLETQKDL